jgi:hypothetical protein
MRKLPGLAAVCLIICLLAGCGPSFTYNHLDRLIPWYVDGYIDLSRDQRAILRGQLEPLLQWHREEELVRYVEILDRIEGDLTQPVTAAVVQIWIDEVIAAAQRTEETMLALALDFGTTMSEAQMAEFVASLRERQREYEEEFLGRSDEQYREDSHAALAGLLERFAGRLRPAQEQRLEAAVAGLVRFDRAWLEDRAHWLRQLEPLLQREPGWQQAVQAAYRARRDNRLPSYRDSLQHNLGVLNPAVAEVLNELSHEQRARLARELGALRARLLQLSGRPLAT